MKIHLELDVRSDGSRDEPDPIAVSEYFQQQYDGETWFEMPNGSDVTIELDQVNLP